MLVDLQELAASIDYDVFLYESSVEQNDILLDQGGAYFEYVNFNDDPAYSNIVIDIDFVDEYQLISPEAVLIHELGHAWYHMEVDENDIPDYLDEELINDIFERDTICPK